MKKLVVLAMASALALNSTTATAFWADTEKKEEKKEKEEAQPVVVNEPEAGKGQVVFFRPGGTGFLIGCGVNENGERVSGLGNGKYFIVQTAPGTHTYSAKSEAKDVITLEVDPGETYYVRCNIKMGILVGRPNLSPSTKEEFDKVSAKLKYVDPEDFGPKEEKDEKKDKKNKKDKKDKD